MPELMNADLLRLFSGQLARGELVLFTGAGFTADCVSSAGESVPVGGALRRLIWDVAFPGQAFNDDVRLPDVFEVALRRAQGELGRVLRSHLTLDPNHVPDYHRWYAIAPWVRMYTLNVDTWPEAVMRRFKNVPQLKTVSALTDQALPASEELACIQLNGRLADFPDVTFSARQYGERTASPDKWFQQLASDLFTHPVLFVGSQLDEPSLWHYLAVRRMRSRRSREVRPRSFLVTPSIDPARRELLQGLNIEWLEGSSERFAEEVLAAVSREIETGRAVIDARRTRRTAPSVIQRVSDIRERPSPAVDARTFLLGREPTWADVEDGYAIRREFDAMLFEAAQDSTTQVLLVTGTAGSGKSTSLLRLALALQAEGRDVLWFDGKEDTELHLGQIRRLIREADAEVLVVDDVDAFGQVAAEFLSEIHAENTNLTIVAAIRTTRLGQTDFETRMTGATELPVPGLADSDIDDLLAALGEARRLGVLRSLTPEQQRQAFRDKAERQLLVAMIEATFGERFDEKIRSECRELDPDAYVVYGVACLATTIRYGLFQEELLIAAGADRAEALRDIRKLVDRHLLVPDEHGRLRVRHRYVAERALAEYKGQRHFAELVESLLFAVATKVGPGHSTRSREHKLLVRLLNHDFMSREISVAADVQRIYDSVEEFLSWEYHYWLQRGSFEVEHGNIRVAENFLGQAKAMAEDDLYVRTEWAYMLLVKAEQAAAADGGRGTSHDDADEGFEELRDVIRRHGQRTPYPYHVLGRQGLRWLERVSLTPVERSRRLGELLEIVREGCSHHLSSQELRTLERTLERAYLSSAISPGN